MPRPNTTRFHRLARCAAAAALCLAACGNDGSGPIDARIGRDAPAECCPLEEPSCDCFYTGGSVENGCSAICDARPDGWMQRVDENGCPEWVGGNDSCLESPDASWPDARPPDDAALDASAAR